MPRHNREPPKGGLVRMGVRGLAGAVGLVSESIQAHRENKAPKTEGEEKFNLNPHPSSKNEVASNDGPSANEDAPPSYDDAVEDMTGRGSYPNEKGKQKQRSDDKDDHASIDFEEVLEEEWSLDDVQDEFIDEYPNQERTRSTETLIDTFLHSHQLLPGTKPGSLPLPVILPQRRPKDRSRGFIRAYAPVLENCAIDQATWLAFLDSFQRSSAANPWLNAINLASFATVVVPHGFGQLVSFAIEQATKAAIELQSRERTSKFLWKINEGFFRPRGLYCLVMTWNPESVYHVEQVNITATIDSRSKAQTGLSGFQSKYRTSDGNTYGEWELPEVAPLVFPALDHLAAQESADAVKKKNKIASGMTFAAEYWDKRATAEYAGKNPNSVLANVPQERFYSRYADPNNRAASGSLISFVSGGHLVPGPQSRGLVGGLVSVAGQAIRGEKQGAEWEHYKQQQGYDPRYDDPYSRHYRGRGRHWGRDLSEGRIGRVSTPIGAWKRLVKKNVLYLMIVNMPSDEEMAAARATVHS